MTTDQDSEKLAPAVRVLADAPIEPQFSEILGLIRRSREQIWRAANLELVELYWSIGEFLSRRTRDAGWGKGTVKRLADWLLGQEPGLRGFSTSNLWRMKQFFEVYDEEPKLAPMVRALPWSANLLILAQCKTTEEREFYLRLASEQHWTKRELDRQLDGGLFERMRLGQPALSPALAAKHPNASSSTSSFTIAVSRRWSRLNSRLGASSQQISGNCSSIWKPSTATIRSPMRIRRLESYSAKVTTRTWLSTH